MRQILNSLLFAVFLTVCGSVAAEPYVSVPKSGELAFAVVRNGDPIGNHVFRFRPDGDRLAVDIDSKIEYKLLFIRLYLHVHKSREKWRGGRLVSMASDTDDNGDEKILKVAVKDGELNIDGPKGDAQVPVDTPPASFWSVESLKSPLLIGTISGGVENVETEFVGDETINVKGQPLKTKRYKMTGDINRDFWFDPADNMALVYLRFEAKDGSTIEYLMK